MRQKKSKAFQRTLWLPKTKSNQSFTSLVKKFACFQLFLETRSNRNSVSFFLFFYKSSLIFQLKRIWIMWLHLLIRKFLNTKMKYFMFCMSVPQSYLKSLCSIRLWLDWSMSKIIISLARWVLEFFPAVYNFISVVFSIFFHTWKFVERLAKNLRESLKNGNFLFAHRLVIMIRFYRIFCILEEFE